MFTTVVLGQDHKTDAKASNSIAKATKLSATAMNSIAFNCKGAEFYCQRQLQM